MDKQLANNEKFFWHRAFFSYKGIIRTKYDVTIP